MTVISALQGLALNLRGAGQHDAALMVAGVVERIKNAPSLYDVATDKDVDNWSNDRLLHAISNGLDELLGKRL